MPKSKQQVKTQAFVVSCGTYPHDILCVFGDRGRILREASKYLNTSGMDYLRGVNFDNSSGIFFDIPCKDVASGRKAWMIWIKGRPKVLSNYAVVQHEIFHAVYHIMHYIGMTLSDDSEEAYAYLTEHLTREIFKKLWV